MASTLEVPCWAACYSHQQMPQEQRADQAETSKMIQLQQKEQR